MKRNTDSGKLPLGGRIEVLRLRLVAVAEEMGETLARTAYSANIKERRDHSCALFDAAGRLLAQAAHIPVHLGSMPTSVAAVLAAMELSEGDAAILNDPFAGGTHLPDITMVTPIRLDGRLIGFAANRAHHADVGGKTPGSMGVATTIDDEGIRIPPTRWMAAGREDAAVRERILAAVRTPIERLGDLRAQLAACAVGQRGLADLVRRYGVDEFGQLSARLLSYADSLMRAMIGGLRPGEYAAEDFLDGDGVEERPIRIAVRIGVGGGRAVVCFDGTERQVAGCVNCPLAVTQSAVLYVFSCLAGERLPHNAGMFAPIEVRAPIGSVVNATYPAAVAGGNVETSQRVVDVVLRALAPALPERIPAGGAGTMTSVSFGGVDPRSGRAVTYYETIAGGMGAGPAWNGESAVHTHMTNTLNTPVEAIETGYPVRIRRYELRVGSGGRGRFRGGDGIVREYEALAPLTVSVLADRATGGGYGLAGAESGSPLRITRIGRNGSETRMPCKATFRLEAGERLVIETPGGGGFGTP